MTGMLFDPFFPLPRTKRSAFSRFPGPRVEHGAGSAKRRSGAHSSACTVASRVARRWAPDLRAARSVRVSDKEASSLPILRLLAVEDALQRFQMPVRLIDSFARHLPPRASPDIPRTAPPPHAAQA